MMPEFKTVGNVGDIAPGTGKAFEFGDQMVAIFLETDGTYLAIDDLCPHMGAVSYTHLTLPTTPYV